MSAHGRRARPKAPRADAAAPAAPARAELPGVAWPLLAAIAACALLRGVAALLPGDALWGWDAARDLPAMVALALALMTALAFTPPVREALNVALEALGRALGRGWGAAAVAALALAAVALLARDPVRFAGDATLRLATVTVRGDDARTLLQAAPLDRALNVALPRALDDALPVGPEGALQIAGALQALAFALAAAAFARALPVHAVARGGAFLALVASGVPVHLAGYAKFGPLLAGLLLLAAGGVRLLRDGASRTGAMQLVCGYGIALLAHRTGLFAAPAALLAAWLAARGTPWPRAPLPARLAFVLVLAASAAAAPWALGLLRHYDRARHLAGAGPTPARLADAFDTLGLLAPLWPAGVLAAGLAWRRPGARAAFAVAAVAAAPWLALLVCVTGSQGAMRDWDMHTPAGLVVAVLAAAALAAAWDGAAPARRTAGAAAAVTLAAATSLWALQASEPAQMRRIGRQLADSSAWSDEAAARGLDFLGTRAYGLQRWDEAATHWEAAARRSPNSRFYYQVGLSNARAGRYAQAEPWIAEAHRRDPGNPDPFVGWALMAMTRNDEAGASAMLDSALARNPRKFDALKLKRMLAEDVGR